MDEHHNVEERGYVPQEVAAVSWRRSITRRCAATTVTVAALSATLSAVSPAPALAQCDAYTNIIDFHMRTEAYTYGEYRMTSGCGLPRYRWVDDPDYTTVISVNNPFDGSLYGKNDIPAHSTAYYELGFVYGGTSFLLRGRVASGASPFYNHDGRLRR
jgi:hypothetical protein